MQSTEEQRPAEVASTSAPDDWELDPADIVFEEKIASGAFGDLYKGTYCGQEVAIKILRNVHTDSQQYQEFLQVSYPVQDYITCWTPPHQFHPSSQISCRERH